MILKPSIAVEDLNLNAVESLQGVGYMAIGKHLCGPATGNSKSSYWHSIYIALDCTYIYRATFVQM